MASSWCPQCMQASWNSAHLAQVERIDGLRCLLGRLKLHDAAPLTADPRHTQPSFPTSTQPATDEPSHNPTIRTAHTANALHQRNSTQQSTHRPSNPAGRHHPCLQRCPAALLLPPTHLGPPLRPPSLKMSTKVTAPANSIPFNECSTVSCQKKPTQQQKRTPPSLLEVVLQVLP